MQFLFFTAFALVILGMYIAIRRRLASPLIITTIGVFSSIITMTLFQVSYGVSPAHGIIMGVVIGTLFSGATLAVAWYFQSNEIRASLNNTQSAAAPDEYYEETS